MANNRIVKDDVVAFRLTPEQRKHIQEIFDAAPPAGIRSIGMQARKLLLDWAHDRLTYRKKSERNQAPELYLPKMAGTSRAA